MIPAYNVRYFGTDQFLIVKNKIIVQGYGNVRL